MIDKIMNELNFKEYHDPYSFNSEPIIKYINTINSNICVNFIFKKVINYKMVIRVYHHSNILNVEIIRDYLTEENLREELYKTILEGIHFSDNPELIDCIIKPEKKNVFHTK